MSTEVAIEMLHSSHSNLDHRYAHDRRYRCFESRPRLAFVKRSPAALADLFALIACTITAYIHAMCEQKFDMYIHTYTFHLRLRSTTRSLARADKYIRVHTSACAVTHDHGYTQTRLLTFLARSRNLSARLCRQPANLLVRVLLVASLYALGRVRVAFRTK